MPTLDLDFYIPVKDGEKSIAACIEAVLKQTCKPRQLTIYLNKNSTDATEEIARAYPVIVREVTVPLSDTRNLAVQELKSEWIGCVDADVIVAPNWLEKLWAKRDSGAALVTGNTEEAVRTPGDLFRSILFPHNWGDADVDNPYSVVSDMIAKRQKIVAAGGYKADLLQYEDADLCRRLKEGGERFFYVAGAKARHLRQDNSFSVLDLSWRYSYLHQKHLLKTPAGLEKKLLNNISLATACLGKALPLNNPELLRIILYLPLHHFYHDLKSHAAQNPGTRPGNTTPPPEPLLGALQQLCGEYAREMRTQATGNPNCIRRFDEYYATFLKRAAAYLPDSFIGEADRTALNQELSSMIKPTGKGGNPWAIADSDWAALLEKAAGWTQRMYGVLPERRFDLSKTGWKDDCVTGGVALAFYRQQTFPDDQPIFTCRDLSSLLASRGQRLLWTETFQGSTIIAYAPAGAMPGHSGAEHGMGQIA